MALIMSVGGAVPAAAGPSQALLYDRMHQTFQALLEVAYGAYLDHFRDQPAQLAVVHYFAGELATDRGQPAAARAHFRLSWQLGRETEYGRRSRCRLDGRAPAGAAWGPYELARMGRTARGRDLGKPPSSLDAVHAAVAAAKSGQAAELGSLLARIGLEPQAVLQRPAASDQHQSARCLLYDPAMLWLYRRAAELEHGPVPTKPPGHEGLAATQAEIRRLRSAGQDRELSLGKFVRRHRALVRRLAWQYRCLGVELNKRADDRQAGTGSDGVTAQQCWQRAAVLGEALFSPDQRGRMDRIDPVFLAELGDVYARQGRYDLMLRYMYSSLGLPARFPPARLIADMAYVAEGIRLVKPELIAGLPVEQEPAETLTQVMFGSLGRASRARPPQPAGRQPGRRRLAWSMLAAGLLCLAAAALWRLRRPAKKRPDPLC